MKKSAFILSAVVFVVLLSFSPSAIFRIPPEGVSLAWYRKMLRYEPFFGSMRLSLVLAGGAPWAAIVLGVPTALTVVRFRFPGRPPRRDGPAAPVGDAGRAGDRGPGNGTEKGG